MFSITVTYDSNGGSACLADTFYVAGVYEDLCEPTKAGYYFRGWYKENGIKVSNGSRITENASHTLYADWQPRS